ncbi:hypothetical protein AMECASPLE_023931 [Ameca splendens]|uniref:Uncharacterized protein n=1 Tax=Ameca splendens TaxID=208324 RepID=A0ABV0ZQZ0_9TELE
MKIEEKNRIETISKLLDEARLIKNEEQLEIFKQNLKKAVTQAYEEETEDKYRLAAAVEHFNDKIDEVNPSLQVLKQASKTNPSAKQMVNIAEHLMSKARTFFVLRMKAFAEGATDTEKNMNDILNVFDPQQDLHAEL